MWCFTATCYTCRVRLLRVCVRACVMELQWWHPQHGRVRATSIHLRDGWRSGLSTGQLPLRLDGQGMYTGKVGTAAALAGGVQLVDTAAGTEAARAVGLTTLALLRHELGSLDVVRRVVQVSAYVNCTPDFFDQPKVRGCNIPLAALGWRLGQRGRDEAVGVRVSAGGERVLGPATGGVGGRG